MKKSEIFQIFDLRLASLGWPSLHLWPWELGLWYIDIINGWDEPVPDPNTPPERNSMSRAPFGTRPDQSSLGDQVKSRHLRTTLRLGLAGQIEVRFRAHALITVALIEGLVRSGQVAIHYWQVSWPKWWCARFLIPKSGNLSLSQIPVEKQGQNNHLTLRRWSFWSCFRQGSGIIQFDRCIDRFSKFF